MSTTKVSEHIPSGLLISTVSSLRSIDSKYHIYRGKDYIKKFCEFLTEHAIKIINFLKNEVIDKIPTGDVKICYICKERFEKNI